MDVRKSLTAITQECCEQYWTSPGDSTPQSSSYKATYHPSRKLSKLDEPGTVGHCWRSRDEFISDVLLRNPSHGYEKVGRPARTYIQQLCADTRCSPDDLLKSKEDREVRRERARNIRADSAAWYIYIYIYNLSTHFVAHIFKWIWDFSLHTFKCSEVFLPSTINSIDNKSFFALSEMISSITM